MNQRNRMGHPATLHVDTPAFLTVTQPAMHVRVVNLFAVIVPFAGLAVAIVLLWGWGFSWLELGLLIGMYVLTGLGITVGYHRLFTHRAFEAPRPIKAILAVLGSMAVEGPLLKWAAQHRLHHHHSDRQGDPHSPHLHGEGLQGMLKGLWHAHLGWTFQPDIPGLERYVKDLLADRVVVVTSRLFSLWAVLGVALPTLFGGLVTMSWTGALLGFIWGGLVRIFLIQHVTFSINSVCHFWGRRPFRSHDQSRNNILFGVIGFGEGWHNNHHAFPASARHGLRWWQVDVSYGVIRTLELLGLAWDVRLPSPASLARKQVI